MDPNSSIVSNFETVCAQLERAETHISAAQQLESLRAAPLSVSLPLARRVLDESSSPFALFHAVLLIRTVTVRAWSNISSSERAATRDYLLNFAVTRAQRTPERANSINEEPALMQAIVAVAVLWKRNWLETTISSSSTSSSSSSSGFESLNGNDDPSWAHGVFFDQVSRLLFSNSSDLERVGSRLALTLVQEMSASDAGLGSSAVSAGGARATALGMSQSFHSESAKAFLKRGLREIFVLLSQSLLQKLSQQQQSSPNLTVSAPVSSPPSPALLLLLLEGLASCLGWDFSGMRGSGSAGAGGLSRVSPGPSWRDLLVDSNRTVSTALLSLYLSTRLATPGSGEAQVSIAARQLLCLLAGLEGDVFANEASAAEYGEKIASCLCSILAEPMLAAVPAMVERDKSRSSAFVNTPDYYECADREAQDVLRAMAVCVRTHRLQQLVRIGGNIPYLMSIASSIGARVLGEMYTLAQDFLKASVDAKAASLALASGPGGRTQNRSHEKSVERAAKLAVSEYIKERYDSAMETIEALLDVWATVTRELGDSEGAVRDATSAEAAASAAALHSISSSLAPYSSDFYEKLVRSRLAIGAAIIRAGLDDDDQLEDATALSDHLDHVAMIGRFNPSLPLSFLHSMLSQASQRMVLLINNKNNNNGQSSPVKEVNRSDVVDLHMSFEELYWLVTYSGHLLADNPLGETPEVPPSLNRLSVKLHAAALSSGRSVTEATQMDPIALLSWEVLQLSNIESSRIEANVNDESSSPLLTEKLLWFQSRWARTYLFIASSSVTSTSAVVTSSSGRNSPAMSMSFFSSAASAAAAATSSSTSALSPSSTSPSFSNTFSSTNPGADARGMSLSLLSAFSDSNPALVCVFDTSNVQKSNFSSSSPTLQPLREGVALRALTIEGSNIGVGGGGGGSAGYLNGRFALELCIRNAMIGLSAWTARRNEERIGDASMQLLRNLCANETIAKFFFLSPSAAKLAEATLSIISGSTSVDPSLQQMGFSLHDPMSPPDVHFRAIAASLCDLLPEIQAKLVSLFLGNLRFIGAEEGSGFFLARDCVIDDDTGAGLSNPSVNMSVRAVGFRWHSFAIPFISRLETRLRSILSSEPFLKSPNDPRVIREIERILQLHSSVFKSAIHGVPSAWHIGASLQCLQACAPLIDYYKAVDRPTTCGLAYCLDFLSIESEVLKEPSASLAVFTAIANVFLTYAKHHQGLVISGSSQQASTTTSTTTAQSKARSAVSPSGGGKMAALTSAFEEEKYEDLLLLLRILELIADKEDLDLSLSSLSSSSITTTTATSSFNFGDNNSMGGGGGGGDKGNNASSCLLIGLSFVVPVMTSHSALLGFPKLLSVYMGVVSHVIQRHPSSLSKMDPSLFSVLVQSLEAGVSHFDGDVTRLSLDAIHGLGFFHFNARRKGGITSSTFDLSAQLARMPILFSGLAKCLLQLSIGSGTGFSPDLTPRVSDALCAMIVCDPQGYVSLVQSLLNSQIAGSSSSKSTGDVSGSTVNSGTKSSTLSLQLQSAFDVLTTELFTLIQSTYTASINNAASITRTSGPLQRHPLDRLSKQAFRKRFEAFVIAVRGLTVVF
jgi:hypothetical protein